MGTRILPSTIPSMTVTFSGGGQPYMLTPFHPHAERDRDYLLAAVLEILEGFLSRDLIGGYQVTDGHDIVGYLIEYLDRRLPVLS